MNIFKKGLLFLMMSPLFLAGQATVLTPQHQSANKNEIKHSFFIAGPNFTGIIGENGEELWDSGKKSARDGYVLKNGNILICWGDEVREYNKKKKVIFTYTRAEKSMELGTAVRLSNGNTMITESGSDPRIVEVNKKGKVVGNVPLKPDTDNVHMQTRMARKLSNGNYLVPHLLAFAVKEYQPDGKVVNVFNTDLEDLGGREAENWPFTAIRLDNGNTVVTLTHGNKVVEFDSNGKVVWKVSNSDLQEAPFVDPCGAQRLPNGNTVIASYGAKKGIKLFELAPDKSMVWNYEGHRVHHFQILTTNGKPIKGTPLK
ncbi:hypothetical protein MWU78_14010 [Arenibacter sp. F26102]|uniref:beta-propeller domain-containing protein n=1 Tax=Arenibacter sp. F26102 TaxID=2926416 RepID=UPI001FF49FEA|nr:hypothetical protein [Arenibacter sp. F26102]MCK0146767.1 hypothetical protein [Arenibacter sp. F26102]